MVVNLVRVTIAGLTGGLWLAACGSGGGFPDARPPDAPTPGGHFALSWSLTDTNGQPITCQQIGGQSVTMLLHNRAFEGGQTEVFVCSTGSGMSQAFSPGTYDISYQLIGTDFHDGKNGLLSEATPQLGVELVSNQTTTLPPITFGMIQATGGLALRIDSGKPNGNCAAPPGGAGISTTSISITRNSDSMCVPMMLTVAGGSAYTVNCTTAVDAPCIDNTQAITATVVPADSYTIHVKGKIGSVVCWTNDDSFVVPPLGMTLTRTLNLAYAMGKPGC